MDRFSYAKITSPFMQSGVNSTAREQKGNVYDKAGENMEQDSR